MTIFDKIKHRALDNKLNLDYIIEKFGMALKDDPLNLTPEQYIINRKIIIPSDKVEAEKLINQLKEFFEYLKRTPKTLTVPKKVLINYFMWKYFIPTDGNGKPLDNFSGEFPKYFIYDVNRKLPIYLDDIKHGFIYEIKVYSSSDTEYNWLHKYKLESYCFISTLKQK